MESKLVWSGSYQAADERGNVLTIGIYTEYTPQTRSGQWMIPGREVHKGPDGKLLVVDEDGSLIEVTTGRRLRRL